MAAQATRGLLGTCTSRVTASSMGDSLNPNAPPRANANFSRRQIRLPVSQAQRTAADTGLAICGRGAIFAAGTVVAQHGSRRTCHDLPGSTQTWSDLGSDP